MDKYLLDTDTVIFTIKRKPVEVKRKFNIHAGEMCISTSTFSELLYGAENSSDPKKIYLPLKGSHLESMCWITMPTLIDSSVNLRMN